MTDKHDNLKLNDSWVLWYHDPNDVNWEISSYKSVATISSIADFWNTYDFLENNKGGLNVNVDMMTDDEKTLYISGYEKK